MFLNQFLLNHRKKTFQIDLLKSFFQSLNSEFKTNSNNFLSRSYLPHSRRLFTRKRQVRFFCRGRITFQGKHCSHLTYFSTHAKEKASEAQGGGVGEASEPSISRQVFRFARASNLSEFYMRAQRSNKNTREERAVNRRTILFKEKYSYTSQILFLCRKTKKVN